MTKKFEYTDIDGVKKEAEAFISSEFVTIAAPNSPVMTTSSGTIHPSLLPAVAVGKASTVVITRKASDPILRGELVRGSSPDHVELADPTLDMDSASVLGMAINDADTEDDVEILILGIITDSIFNIFGTNVPIFLDDAGGRYLINGIGTGAWAGKDNQIAEWNGSAWVYTVPTAGGHVSSDAETSVIYIFNGTSWDSKSYEATTASNGLVKVGNDIRIDAGAAGAGLGFSSGVLSVNVDNSSVEINVDTLRVKALGIKDTMIDFGTGAGQVSASDIPLADAGSYFPTDTVEAGLQYLAAQLTEQGVEYTVGVGGVTKGDLVYISGPNTVSKFSTLTSPEFAVGVALATVAEAGTVKVLSNDTKLTGVLSGAAPGDVYYWTGSALSSSIPSGGGAYVWRVGIAKNSTDLHIEVASVKKNA